MDYEVTSPSGKKYTVSAPEGATQDQVLSYAQSQFGHLEAPSEQPSMLSQVGRQLGLTGRYAVEGVAALPGMLGNAVAYPVNKGLKAMGVDYQFPDQNQAVSSALTSAGLPEPQGKAERIIGDASRAVAGAGTNMGIGGILSGVANPVAQGVGASMQAGPTMQAISAATGGTASGLTRENGGGQLAQFAAGLAGGMAPTALQSGANVLARTASNIVKPITKSGQQEIAGQVLQDQATDPVRAAANLRAAQDIVPGSQQTTGPASQDIGLLSLQKGLQSKNPADFGERLSEQNTARQQALSNLAGTPEGVQAMQKARDVATGPMRENAFANTYAADNTPVMSKIDEILASPAGKRETVSKTMEWAKNLIGTETDPASLYEIRKDLQLAQRGKLQPTSPNAPAASVLALAKGQLGDVINSLDATIENAAPGFKAYLDRYKQLSIPIDQAKILQEIQKRSQLQSMDPTTQQQFLGPANFGRAVDAAIVKNPGKLSPQQLNQLNAIRTDLQMGQAINSPLVKAPGSDTFQNLSIAQAIGGGAAAQHPMMKIISSPLNWIYKAGGADPAVNEILTNAMLDPKLAATLLTKATPKSVQTFSEALKMKAVSGALGTAAQLAATQSKWQENKDTQQAAQQVVTQ